MSACQTASPSPRPPNRLAVLDHIGNHVDFRIGLVERLAIGIGPGRIEFAEASAEGEKPRIGQSLSADHDDKPRAPSRLDGVDLALRKRFCEIDAAHFSAQWRIKVRYHIRHWYPPFRR